VAQRLPRVFLHALHSDGTVSSICRRCQMTVATKPNEVDLRKPEEGHICSNLDLGGLLHSKRLAEAED
jgi:hypothetical protein